MNFKPTILKLIVSILIGFLFVILVTRNICFGSCPPFIKIIEGFFSGVITNIIASWVSTIVVAFITYLIWSLIQKKK
jgi:phosphotransferase system  glucose/maltose/N-acetylglucosamine-specific IIC component